MWRWLGLAAALGACAPAPAPTPATPAPPVSPPPVPAHAKTPEPAGPVSVTQIWQQAIDGDLASAQRSLERFRSQPGDDPKPRSRRLSIVCSDDEQRCVFLLGAAGIGVTDGSGRALGLLPSQLGRPFAFVGATRLLYLTGMVRPGTVVDVDDGKVVLEIPASGWSTTDIVDHYVVFGLGYVSPPTKPPPDSDDEPVEEQRVAVWDGARRQMLLEHQAPLGEYPLPRLSEDRELLTVSTDSGAFVWDLESRQLLSSSKHPQVGSPVSASENHIALISYGRRGADVQLLDRRGKRVGSTRACGKPHVVALSPSGKLLALGGERQACVLRVPSLTPITRAVVRTDSKDDDTELRWAQFFQNERVVMFKNAKGEAHLLEVGGPRRLTRRGDVHETRSGQLAVREWGTKSLVLLQDLSETSRRPLTPEEQKNERLIPELFPPMPKRLEERLLEQPCEAHGKLFPPSLCQ